MHPSPDQAPATPPDQPDQPDVVVERHSEVAVIRLNRPARLNAVTTRSLTDLIAALDACDADDAIRAVVLTGTGRAFCAGADISGGGETFAIDPDQDSGTAPPDTGG